MKILYRQNKEIPGEGDLFDYGIKDCCLKEIKNKADYKKTTLKHHYHVEYEIHIVVCGYQCYEADGTVYEVAENEFIIIPPGVKHRVVSFSENLIKYSLTFTCEDGFGYCLYHGEVPRCVRDGIEFITEEFRQNFSSSARLIENRIFEIAIMLMRKSGYKEQKAKAPFLWTDSRIDIAKKFICDNVERNPDVADVAAYCHISTRQLARGFMECEGISPAKYINNEKMRRIGEYVKSTDMSLRQISEMFSYNNEYYFNHSFKMHFGMPPMAYRKMHR